MADIPGLIAGLTICPDVVTPVADKQMLHRAIANLVGIPLAQRRTGNNSLWMAFDQMGVLSFLGDLITLREDNIMYLQIRPTRTVPHPVPIPIMWKCKTVIIVATYHHYAPLKNVSLDMRFFPVKLFDHFRISLYHHDEKIIPWQVELPSQVNAKASFLKSIKPNSKEYKIFQDDKSWLPFRESTETTIMSHNLVAMILPPYEIDPNMGEFVTDPITDKLIPYEPDDPRLDEIQRTWFFKVPVDVCQTLVAKKIMNQNRDTMDTRKVWYELCTHYQNSMSSKMLSQQLLQYAHTAQLVNSGHRGTNQASISNFAKIIRQYQALQTDENKLSDQMCVDFLNNSMRGTTHLEGVLDTYCTARKAAGIPDHSTLLLKNMLKGLSRQLNHTTRLSDKAVIVVDEALIST